METGRSVRRQAQDSGREAWGRDVTAGWDSVSPLHGTGWHHFCALCCERRPLESGYVVGGWRDKDAARREDENNHGSSHGSGA